MQNNTDNSASLDTALNGVQDASLRISGQLEDFKDALAKLTDSPFVAKMRALQDSIL